MHVGPGPILGPNQSMRKRVILGSRIANGTPKICRLETGQKVTVRVKCDPKKVDLENDAPFHKFSGAMLVWRGLLWRLKSRILCWELLGCFCAARLVYATWGSSSHFGVYFSIMKPGVCSKFHQKHGSGWMFLRGIRGCTVVKTPSKFNMETWKSPKMNENDDDFQHKLVLSWESLGMLHMKFHSVVFFLLIRWFEKSPQKLQPPSTAPGKSHISTTSEKTTTTETTSFSQMSKSSSASSKVHHTVYGALGSSPKSGESMHQQNVTMNHFVGVCCQNESAKRNDNINT